MKKYIVTTTINSPTIATKKFCTFKEWNFVIIGDTKTPHDDYYELEKEHDNFTYLHPDTQDKLYPELSKLIGWKTIQRRNIGFIYAYQQGADIVATVDDDNIPYDNWGEEIYVGQTIEYDCYKANDNVFDPLSITKDNHVWHRGFPIQLLQNRHNVEYRGKAHKKVLIQADLWDGDPDIDAMARLSFKPTVKYSDITSPYGTEQLAPFNSQNTFLAREVLPFYSVLPFVGRMDDIWGGYILQHYFPNSVIYNKATVYQDRNLQDLVTNLENEIIGYRNTDNLLKELHNFEDYLPARTKLFYQLYKKEFKK